MTPEERQMLSGLFDRVRGQGNAPRDADAEAFINDAVRQQPYAPYLLAQTVLVQEQGLSAANNRIQELEAQVRNGGQKQASGSFLGDLGRSIFGGGQAGQPQRPQQPGGYPPAQSGYQPQQSGPWGNAGQAQMAPNQQMMPNQQMAGGQMMQQRGGGSSFLHGALGTAAGVAGGVLLANSMQSLFSSHSATAASMAGGDFAAGSAGGGNDWGSAAAGGAAGGSDWGSGGTPDQSTSSDWGSAAPSNDTASDWGGGGSDVASNDSGGDWGGGGSDSSFDV